MEDVPNRQDTSFNMMPIFRKLSLELHISSYPPAVDPVVQDIAICVIHLRSLAVIAIYPVYV